MQWFFNYNICLNLNINCNSVSLSAQGFYQIPNIGHNWITNEGNIYGYYTYGVACSEVEIDTLTGDHKVLRTDIVMDLGFKFKCSVFTQTTLMLWF